MRWVLILALPALLGVVALVMTEVGTRWLFTQAERHAPMEFRVEAVDGTLFRGLSLIGLQVESAGTRIHLERGRVQLSAVSLLKFTLRIPELSLAGLTVGLPEPEPQPPQPPGTLTVPEEIELPVRFVVERFILMDLTIQRGGETLIELDRIALRLEAGPEVLRVDALQLEMPNIEVWMDAELWPSGEYPLLVQARWRLALPESLAAGLETSHAEGELMVDGDLLGSLEAIHKLQAGLTLETRLGAEDLLGTMQVRLDSHWMAFHYRLDPETIVSIDDGDIALHGGLDAWTARLVTGAHMTGLPTVRLEAALSGSGEHAGIDSLSLSSDAGQVHLQGRLGWNETLTWDLQAGIRGLSAPALGLEPDFTIETLSLASSGSLPHAADLALEDRLLAITAAVEIHELRAEVAGQDLQGVGRFAVEHGSARFDDLLLRLGPDGSFRLVGEAELGAKTPYRIAVTADALDLGFLVPDRQLVLDRLRLQAEGLLGLETGNIEAAIELTDLSARLDGHEIAAHAKLNLTETEADIRTLEVSLPADGLLSVSGRVAYGTGIGWDLFISGRGIDPGVFAPDLSGRLVVELASRGALPPDQELQAEVELSELHGTLRGQPVEGIAVLAVNGQQIRIDRLDLGMGANRLSANGHLDERLALELTLDAPELERIFPDLAGWIRLDASLSGTMESPRVVASAEGSGLRYAELELDGLHLRLDAGLDPEAPAELDLRLSGIRAAGQHVEEVRAGAEGRASAHQLTLAVDAADLGRLTVKASGGYELDQTRWRGRLERMDIAQPLAGDWTLREPVLVSASSERATLGELCLGRERARLCLRGDWDASVGGQGQASVEAFDLAWLSPLLPPDTTIEGNLMADLRASLDPAGRLRVEVDVPPAAGQIRFELADGTPQAIPYWDLRLAVTVDDRSLDGTVELSFLDDGEARATVRLRPEGDRYRLDGAFRAGLQRLEWIGALSPEIQDVRGRLEAELTLGGLLDDPMLSGGVRLAEASVTIPKAGITLEVPQMAAEAVSEGQMRISGELRSGDESLHLEGELILRDLRPQAEILIRGERFLALDRPDVRARISPELKVNFQPELLTVRGEIRVPSALIRPPDLPPGSVAVSQDEIVVGEETESDPVLPMDIRVRVILGDDVRFEGFDLEARFAGDLDVVDLPGRPPQIFGEVSIPEGRYKAWGQDLALERGLVMFQGPVDTPGIDLRAVRRVRVYNVVVGVEIGGTSAALSSRVFSQPPMDDTEAMAFLLTGRPLAGASQSDGNLIVAAAAAWGLEKAGLISQRLVSELGLEIELDTEDGLERSALTIGTYLSPNLLLRYGVDLFDGSARVMLRYDLTRSLSVETTSRADGQGIDLIYRIER